MATMHCTVALPDKALFQGRVSYASIPGSDGYFGVLPGHELSVSLNREGGLLTLHVGEDDTDVRKYMVMGGASSVLDGKVTVLARFGTPVEDIDAAQVREETEECRNELAELQQKAELTSQDEAQKVTLQKKLQWNEALLKYVGGVSE